MAWGTNEKQRFGCHGHRSPLAAKGPPSGVRQEPASRSHTIPLPSLCFVHISQSKSSILTWFLTMKLAQHKPVNVLSLKLACQLKSFVGSSSSWDPSLYCVWVFPRPSSKQSSFFYETTCRKAKIITTVSVPWTLLQGILPLFGAVTAGEGWSTSGIQLWHFLRVWGTSQHQWAFSMMCHAGTPGHSSSHQWCSVNPLILLCPWHSDRVQQCSENPPGELCASTDCWDSGGFLPDTTGNSTCSSAPYVLYT